MTSTEFENGGRVTQRDLYEALTDFRKENRDDMALLKKEVLEALAATLAEFREYRIEHAQAHDALERTGTSALGAHIRKRELEEAVLSTKVTMAKTVALFVAHNWKALLVVLTFIVYWLADLDLASILHK